MDTNDNYYHKYLKYKANPTLIAKLDHTFRVSDIVLRHSFACIQERKVKDKPRKKKAPVAA